jgi:hypothetical protein
VAAPASEKKPTGWSDADKFTVLLESAELMQKGFSPLLDGMHTRGGQSGKSEI